MAAAYTAGPGGSRCWDFSKPGVRQAYVNSLWSELSTPLSCSSSPCFCKPSFQAERAPTAEYHIRVGHVDDVEASPLREWLPGCQWKERWQRYESGHHSTELLVAHYDIDHALRALLAAGFKQLNPINTFRLLVDEAQPDRVRVSLRVASNGSSWRDKMPWIDSKGVFLLTLPMQAEFSCARPDLHRTLSALYEQGFAESRPDEEGYESSSCVRCWSSAALLRGKDGKKQRTWRVTPRIGSKSEGEKRPLLKQVNSNSSRNSMDAKQSRSMEPTSAVEATHQPVADESKEEEDSDEKGNGGPALSPPASRVGTAC